MQPMNTRNSVVAKARNNIDFEEAEALEALEPGQGVAVGDGGYETVAADSRSKRVVREQRNPGSRGVETDESPLELGYEAGDNVESVGFLAHERARCQVEADAAAAETINEGDELGWNADGYLSPNAGEYVAVARDGEKDDDALPVEIADGETAFVLVEFY